MVHSVVDWLPVWLIFTTQLSDRLCVSTSSLFKFCWMLKWFGYARFSGIYGLGFGSHFHAILYSEISTWPEQWHAAGGTYLTLAKNVCKHMTRITSTTNPKHDAACMLVQDAPSKQPLAASTLAV
jgi:hypothetical protein